MAANALPAPLPIEPLPAAGLPPMDPPLEVQPSRAPLPPAEEAAAGKLPGGFTAGCPASAPDDAACIGLCPVLGDGAPIHDGRDEDSPDCPPVEEALLPMGGGFPRAAPVLAALPERMGAFTGLLKEDVRRWLLPGWGPGPAAAVAEAAAAVEPGGAEVEEARELRAAGGESSKSPARATSMLSSSCFTVLHTTDMTETFEAHRGDSSSIY